MKQITKAAIAIAIVSAAKAVLINGVFLFPNAPFAIEGISAALSAAGIAVLEDFLVTALALSVLALVLGVCLYFSEYGDNAEQAARQDRPQAKLCVVYANPNSPSEAATHLALSSVTHRLRSEGWIVEWSGPETLEVYKKGSRGQIPLPAGVGDELMLAGWKATYQGAQFMPPPWWVSNDPIELQGYYKIERG